MSANQAVADLLTRISQMQDLLGEDSFRSSSNARAARTIADLTTDVAALAADRAELLDVPGIGPKIADKVIEFVTTGRIREYDEYLKKVPAGLLALLNVPGLGPKTVRLLWTERGVTDVAGLKRIIEDGSILTVPRMGAKSVEKIKASLAFMETSGQRLPLGLAVPIAKRFVEHLSKIKGVDRVAYAGSLRRGKDTIGDIDILVSARDPGPVGEAFRAMPGVREVLSAGETKASIRYAIASDDATLTKDGEDIRGTLGPTVQVDLRVLPAASWGAALMYFTGSKEHNIRLRERAIKMGYTLNDWGLFPIDEEKTAPHLRGVKPVAGKSEEEIYAKLGLPYLPPEVREDRAELTLKETPRLVELTDIRAELHAHTTASDGMMSIEELVGEAKRRGFHTIAVTDHSKSSAQAGGLSVERLMEHIEAVRAVGAKTKGITVLVGSEVDILADGRLDYDDAVLKQLDVVVASPHTALSQEAEAATKRLLAAIRNPYVHVLGHPTGRIVNRRPGLSPDVGAMIAAAKEHRVALEINAHWLRLDLRDTHVRAATDAGCLIAIDCDDHSPEDFDNLGYGVTTARRGWLTPEACVNAWSAKKLHEWLKSKGRRG
ncbi:MAG: DNA polymerase/3'-5' exonuclease PolX [Phycisphaerales bacterium]